MTTRREFLKFLVAAGMLTMTTQANPKRTKAQSGETVIVIGAGMAGLAAARLLSDQGYTVQILEARDRIGGRVWTDHSMDNIPLDLGASWIHGVRGNPIMALAQELGETTLPTDYENLVVYTADGEEVEESTLEEYTQAFEEMMAEIGDADEALERDVSLGSAIAEWAEYEELNDEERIALNFIVNTVIEQDYAADVDTLSAWYWDSDSELPGGDVLFPNGYQRLANALALTMDIRTSEVVTAVKLQANQIEVETKTSSYSAERVLITVPLGILQAGHILFDPPLSTSKQSALDNLQMGILNKTYAKFPTVFWDDDVELIGYADENVKGRWASFLNIHKVNGEPILLGFNAGTFGRQIESWTDEEILADMMSVLRTIYGNNIPDPTTYIITRWGKDPYTLGSYSSLGVGATPQDVQHLAAPIQNRIFFAGEATHSEFPATVHGAFLSGQRAAEEVMDAS